MIGVLEVSNITNDLFGFDEEYFGLVLSNFCSWKITNCILYRLQQEEIRYFPID